MARTVTARYLPSLREHARMLAVRAAIAATTRCLRMLAWAVAPFGIQVNVSVTGPKDEASG